VDLKVAVILLVLGQDDDWSSFYSKLVERPEKTAIGTAIQTVANSNETDSSDPS
jgi:hypothetical protein